VPADRKMGVAYVGGLKPTTIERHRDAVIKGRSATL
jgi:hypothetical protein